MNPPQRISSETAHQMGSLQDCNGSALQLVINFSKPTRRHSRATGARDTTKLYYTPVCCYPRHQLLACRRARFRRRNFFLRHFHRWLPVFFQAREPRFMVNSHPTCLPYMRASGTAHHSLDHDSFPRSIAQITSIRTGLISLRAASSFDLGWVLKSKTQKMLQTIRGIKSGRKIVRDC